MTGDSDSSDDISQGEAYKRAGQGGHGRAVLPSMQFVCTKGVALV